MEDNPIPVDDDFPPELFRRLRRLLDESVARQEPAARQPLMHAIDGEPGTTLTAVLRKVDRVPLVFVTVTVGESVEWSTQYDAADIGVFLDDDGDMAWIPHED